VIKLRSHQANDRGKLQWALIWSIATLALSLTVSEIRPLRPNRCSYGYYWQSIESRQRPVRWYHRRPSTTYRLATIPHDWHTLVRYGSLGSSMVKDLHVFWKPICDFLFVINSNLGSMSHRLATIHP